MTAIAIMTLPISVLACCAGLYVTGQTINVMTLAGLTLAIGPMVDSAIICLENTHRHLGLGVTPREAAFLGASEVAMPELVSTLCTFLVLAPLALMPGLGEFLFRPMAMAVAFAMIAAYLLSRTLVPACSRVLAQAARRATAPEAAIMPMATVMSDVREQHASEPETFQINGNGHDQPEGNIVARAFARWERMIDDGHRVLRPGARRRPAAPAPDGRRRLRPAGADPRGLLADPAQGVLPRGRRRARSRCTSGRPAARGSRRPRSGSRRSRSSSARPSTRKTCNWSSPRSA